MSPRTLRDVGPRPAAARRDPLGKAALFSDRLPGEAGPGGPGRRRPGTLVVDCSACSTSTRVSYLEFALGNLPFSMWLPPLPALQFNRRMTCPACGEWTWVRARWLA